MCDGVCATTPDFNKLMAAGAVDVDVNAHTDASMRDDSGMRYVSQGPRTDLGDITLKVIATGWVYWILMRVQ